MTHSKSNTVVCAHCQLGDVCQHYGVQVGHDGVQFDDVPRSPVQKGEEACVAGAPFESLFAIHEGAFKSIVVLPDETERVTGFYFAGEVIGAEGVSSGQYGRSVVALQTSEVCYIPKSSFSADDAGGQQIHQGLLVAMSHQIRNEQWTGLMAAHRAEQRVALFLYMVSKRREYHGFDPMELRLPMSRDDIANYLGLAVETVSRSFQKLKTSGLIQVSGRKVILEDRNALQQFQ